nr:uncharacterized protein LOC123479077 [Desmodus rotundus]
MGLTACGLPPCLTHREGPSHTGGLTLQQRAGRPFLQVHVDGGAPSFLPHFRRSQHLSPDGGTWEKTWWPALGLQSGLSCPRVGGVREPTGSARPRRWSLEAAGKAVRATRRTEVLPQLGRPAGGRRGEESGLSTGPARAGQVPMRSGPGSSGAEGPVAATALGASCAGRWDSERPAPVGPWPPCPQTWVPPALPHPRQPACGPPCCAGARPPAASEKGCPGGSVPETLHTQVSLPYSHCSRGSVGGAGPGALPATPRRLCCLFASLLLPGVPKPILTPALFFF